jgi:hypothetical protein
MMVLLAVGLAVGGCAPAKFTFATSPSIDKYRVRTVAVLPFEALTTPQAVESAAPDLAAPQGARRSDMVIAIPPSGEKTDQPTAVVPALAAQKITQMMYGKLRHLEGLRIIEPEVGARLVPTIKSPPGGAGEERVAREVAGRLSADAVMTGRVLIYQERVGGKFGADPATVGFEVKLYGADGETLWTGNYFERQRALNEDLVGFLQRGGVFVTAEELAEFGANHLVEKFPFGH